MLQAIRDHLTGWVSIFLFIIIGLAFALWGVPNEFTSRNTVAQVNGEEIPVEEIRRAYRNQLNQFQQFSDVTPEQEDLIRNQVLQGLVTDEVMSQHSAEEGYYVGNKALETYIRNMEAFQDQGQFSIELFRSRLSLQGMSPQYFEEQIRRALRISQLRRAISETAFVTPRELEMRLKLEREQRSAEWLQLSVADETGSVEVSDEEIQAYYDDNSELYMRPESVDIEYVSVSLDDLAAKIAISDADLMEFYQREVESGRFQQPEERNARHILIAVDDDTDDAAASELAADVLARLQNGEDFAAVAAEVSDDPGSAPEGGDLGWAQRTAYVGAFADALFSMENDELRGPVRTEFGYHIIRMEGQRGGVAKPFEDVEADLRQEYARILADDQFFESSERMADLAFENPQTLEPITVELDLEPVRLEGLGRAGGAGIAANLSIIDAAFSERVLDQRENSDVIEITPEQRVVMRVSNYTPSELRPLDEVRDSIEVALRQKKARDLAREQGEALLARARAGESLEALAAEAGVEHQPQTDYRRTAALPTAMREKLFEASKPAEGDLTIEGVALADGGYAVFALSAVKPGNTDNLGATDPVADQEGIGDLTAYITQLRDDASVTLRPEMLQ